MNRDRVLIVDDNAMNLKVARIALEGQGFEVRVASDGEQALALLPVFRPRLILMDIQLPDVDGLALTRRIKDDPGYRDVAIVAVTAYAMAGDRERAIRAGCDGYIAKPVDPIALPAQLMEIIERRGGSSPRADPEAPSAASAPSSAPDRDRPARTPVLLVEDNPSLRKLFRTCLENNGFEVWEAASAREALDAGARRRPDLVVQDFGLPDMDGYELGRRLRETFEGGPVPILCVSGFMSSAIEAEDSNGVFERVLVKPIDPFELANVARQVVAAARPLVPAAPDAPALLLVDDDPEWRKIAAITLSQAGFRVSTAPDAASALAAARRDVPDLIVSDILMPKMDGFAFCLAVRSDEALREIPVVLASSFYSSDEDRGLAARVGANAVVSKAAGADLLVPAAHAALSAAAAHPSCTSAPPMDEEHLRRSLVTFERSQRRNARLVQRSRLLEAQLTVLSRIVDARVRQGSMSELMQDILSECLAMAGISKGAIFEASPSGSLALTNQIGFSISGASSLEALANDPVLHEIFTSQKTTVLHSDSVPDDPSKRVFLGLELSSLVLIPVAWAEAHAGLVLIGSRRADLHGDDVVSFARVLSAELGQAFRLTNAFARLAESEQRYRTLAEHAHDMITLLTPEGHIREVNRRCAEVLGRPASDLVGRHIREIAAGGSEATNVEIHDDLVAAGSGRTPPVALRRGDGSTVLVEFSSANLDLGGQPMVLTIGRDVTEQVRTRAQLTVSDRMASIGTLAAGVAHEINNPLAAVIGNLEIAALELAQLGNAVGDGPAAENLRVSLHEGLAAAERVARIVKDLKIFSRAEEDRRGPVDVRRTLEAALRMAANEIRHRARLATDFGDVPAVDGDESRLGQVFLNLVVNAAQAIPEGRANENEIRISTSLDPGGRVVVRIADTGEGMPPEVVQRIFTPFFTTKPAGAGTGLGLAICHRIVTDLGGEIAVDSRAGAGTTVTVTLRAHAAPSPDDAAAPAVPPPGHRGRVLVLDDDPQVGSATRRILEGEHDVTALTDATAALDRIAAGERFDAILCDLMMPVMTGMDFHDALRRVSVEQAERVVFVTGGAFTARAREFLDRSANGRIEKPFRATELRALLNERMR